MNLISLLSDIAAQAGYTISASTGTDVANKTRAIRRLTAVKSDIISRFGGKWSPNYREGWLALPAVDQTGTVLMTNGSRAVVGTGTAFASTMKGRKIKGPDGAYYKIASVSSVTALVISEPFQGVTASTDTYIWKDEYCLYPEVMSIGGFIDYELQGTMREAWPRDMKASYSNPAYADLPDVYTLLGRETTVISYSTGTVSVTLNTNTWTGVGTAWLANIQPGTLFTVGSYTYTVRRVNSDTELETYQLAIAAASGLTYSSTIKNTPAIRFKMPTTQRIVHYWYWAKDVPLFNDNDEDWICEQFPKVIIDGVLKYDYADKSDVMRLDRATMAYENAIKDMHVAMEDAYTGPRTIGYYIPDNARD